jgi:hypothetical protein
MLVLFAALSVSETSSPKLTWQKCTKAGCTSITGSVVADKENRGTETEPIADYGARLGVTTTGGTLKQKLVTVYNGKKTIGSRLYLLTSDGGSYELFNFVGKEISYDVDLSQILCGVNAAFYTGEMPAKGTGAAGAVYGGGYCDANYVGGNGCHEMDIQEANKYAMVMTMHTCQSLGIQAGRGSCDNGGCGFTAYRFGAKTFWGGDVNVNTKITVVTQFIGSGVGMSEIKRFYVQGGKVIKNAAVKVWGSQQAFDSIVPGFCQASGHSTDGWHSLNQMAASFARGHALIFSLWDSNDMGWLDGQGGEYGPCDNPSTASIEALHPDMTVTWSNIKFGDMDSTY